MNKEIILGMIQPYVKDSAITNDEFNKLFYLLNEKELKDAKNIIYSNGISIIEKHSKNIILSDEENMIDDDFEVLYDTAIFEDNESSREILQVNKKILQSNENLCYLIQNGNEQAKQDLCIKNRKLVMKYASIYQKKYRNRLEIDDLEQVGYMGLIKAAEKFDSKQGTRFSTYAVWWIKQAISREIIDHGYVVRIPVHMMEKINKVLYVANLLDNKGMELDDRIKEIANRLGLSEIEVRECFVLKNNYLTNASLNTLVGDSEETELIELIPMDTHKGTESIVEEMILHDSLEKIISELNEKEQNIIRLRFGLEDNRIRTLEEIGQMYGVTRERIRQIEAKAIKKLRNPKRIRMIKEFYEG